MRCTPGEWDFSYDPTSKFNIQGVVSAGNWRWTSNESVDLINRTTNAFITRLDDGAIADTLVNLDGVKVGDAAQRQISLPHGTRPSEAPTSPFGTPISGNTTPTSLQGM